MKHHLIAAGLAVALSIAGGPLAGAQTCAGFAPFANAHARLNGDFSIADHATTYGASAVFGGSTPKLFGGVSLSGTRFDGVDETGRNFGLSGGFSVPVGSLPKTEFCPVGDFVHTWGPDAGTASTSSDAVALGGAIGHPFLANSALTVIPFADLRWVHVSGTVEDRSVSASRSDTFATLTLGGGIMFTKIVTLRPAVSIPIAEDNASTVFLISIAFNVGK